MLFECGIIGICLTDLTNLAVFFIECLDVVLLALLHITEMTYSFSDILILFLLGKKLTGLQLEPFYALSLGLEQFGALIFLPNFHPVPSSISYSCNGLLSHVLDLSPLLKRLFLFFSHLCSVSRYLLLLVEVFLCAQHA